MLANPVYKKKKGNKERKGFQTQAIVQGVQSASQQRKSALSQFANIWRKIMC